MTYTFSEDGKALTETEQGVTLPVDYSFSTVIDFVHSSETHFEELQALCLGMANHIEKLECAKSREKGLIDGRCEAYYELYEDLGKLKWAGADDGWDSAIIAVRAELEKLIRNEVNPAALRHLKGKYPED